MSSQPKPGRNDPCPCGSGRKYKNCCEAAEAAAPVVHRKKKLLIGLLIVLVGVLGYRGVMVFTGDEAGAGGELPAGQAPAHGEYDAANNRYWHAEHGHWHDGPPPGVGGGLGPTPPDAFGPDWRGGPPPGALGPQGGEAPEEESTPEPWAYDAVNDRHWDPNHGHWHRGPPPQGR